VSQGQPVRLRASLIWRDEVMADVVLRRPGKLTIGPHRRSTFVLPDLGLPARFAIVRKGRGGYLLTLGDGMSGRFSVDGVEHDVADWVRREGEGGSGNGGRKARRNSDSATFRATPIGSRDWGVIDLDASGDYKLYFQFVPYDGPLPFTYVSALELLAPALAFSVLLHLILIAVTFGLRSDEEPFVWPGPRALLGNYLVSRIEPTPPPPDVKVGVSAPAASKQGAAKAVRSATKGTEGKAGGEGKEPRAREPDAKEAPPAAPPKVALFEDRNRRVIDNIIQTDVQTSLAKFTGLPGPRQRGAIGAGTGRGTGFGPGQGTGTTRGSRGTGPGGGGSAEGDFQSQGRIDTGETRAPKGSGGAGSGVKEVAVVGTGTPGGDFGGLTREEIDKVIKARQGLIRACYQRELNRARDLGGKLNVKFVIGGDGAVKSTAIAPGSTLHNDAVESCVRSQIARLRFPAKGGTATVNYPFVFSQG